MRTYTTLQHISLLVALVVLTTWSAAAKPGAVGDGFQAAYLYLGNSADMDDGAGGHYKDLAGIANGDPAAGDSAWFLSRKSDGGGYLYAIPYTENLGTDFAFDRRQLAVRDAAGRLCGHVGDIDYATRATDAGAVGYLVGGFDNCDDANRGQLAFFRASDVTSQAADPLAAWAVLDVGNVQQQGAPWAAFGATTTIEVDGEPHEAVRVYSSSGRTRDDDAVFEYTVLWEEIAAGGVLPLRRHRRVPLVDFDGRAVHLDRRQGGDLSTDGRLFFVSQGLSEYSSDLGLPDDLPSFEQRDTDRRLLVFEVGDEGEPWRLLKRSAQTTYPFRFQAGDLEEPEGLSYFDVSRVPGYRSNMLRGELFVVLIGYAKVKLKVGVKWHGPIPVPKFEWRFKPQGIYVKHYTSRIAVGSGDSVAATVREHWGGHGAWDGAQLELAPGTYPGAFRLQANALWAPPNDPRKSMRIVAARGQARLVADGP
jgi:hypothetical protein